MNKQLLSMLICPQSKGELKLKKGDANGDGAELICSFSGLAYPIRDGVPVMLVEEARRMSEEEKLEWAQKTSEKATHSDG